MLKCQKRQATDTAAAMLLRMRSLERKAAQDGGRAAREAARPNANQLIGGVVVSFPASAEGRS